MQSLPAQLLRLSACAGERRAGDGDGFHTDLCVSVGRWCHTHLMHRLSASLALLAILIATAGCSSLPDTEPQHLPTPEGGVREYYPLTGTDVRMPLFIGMTYGEAASSAKKLDMTVMAEDASSEDRNPQYSGWTVIAQDPAPGTAARNSVKLLLLPSDHAQEKVEAALAEDPHVDEERFTGVVTGYGEQSLSLDIIQVDGVSVQLDLIDPMSADCGAGKYSGQAQAARESLIPVGAQVLVVMAEKGDDRAFLHAWPAQADPPLASLNEQLVRSGWWEPEVTFDGGFRTNDPRVASMPYTPAAGSLSQGVRADYAPLIAAAGTENIQTSPGAYAACQSVADADVAAFLASTEETNRRIAELEAEYQRRQESGSNTCIDGDGDGICYER